jgi:hypothetical protein
MATLYITEFLSSTPSGVGVPVGQYPAIARQTVAIGGASVQSAQFNTKTTFVRVHTDSVCSVLVDLVTNNPTATTADERLAANQTEYFGIPYNSGMQLAVISNS